VEIIRRNADYALRALVELARIGKSERRSVRNLSQETAVPEIFLRKILQKMAAADLVSSVRGPDGGYSLKKDPRSISLLDIIEGAQGKLAINKCFVDGPGCPRQKICDLKDRFVAVQEEMVSLLKGVTLDALATNGEKTG